MTGLLPSPRVNFQSSNKERSVSIISGTADATCLYSPVFISTLGCPTLTCPHSQRWAGSCHTSFFIGFYKSCSVVNKLVLLCPFPLLDLNRPEVSPGSPCLAVFMGRTAVPPNPTHFYVYKLCFHFASFKIFYNFSWDFFFGPHVI